MTLNKPVNADKLIWDLEGEEKMVSPKELESILEKMYNEEYARAQRILGKFRKPHFVVFFVEPPVDICGLFLEEKYILLENGSYYGPEINLYVWSGYALSVAEQIIRHELIHAFLAHGPLFEKYLRKIGGNLDDED
jgi:hypothetical protein